MANIITLSDNGKMRLEMEIVSGRVQLRPIGIIDEDVNFSVVLGLVPKLNPNDKVLRFDMGRISRMNSCGIREWLLLMEHLAAPSVRCEFVNVNQLFIEQANMIPTMFGRKGSAVLTCQAPYNCPECNIVVMRTFEPDQVTSESEEPRAPDCKCDKCGGELEFDWLEEEYFGFITRL
jgi:hypothetical protein